MLEGLNIQMASVEARKAEEKRLLEEEARICREEAELRKSETNNLLLYRKELKKEQK